MARVKGGLFTATLDINKRFPLDSRMLVAKREDLINPKTWMTNTLSTDATYNVMIVSVNSDGEHNGVYYLIDRKSITTDNYVAYQAALNAGFDVSTYFSMWMKLGTLADLEAAEKRLKEQIENVKPSIDLRPVDGTIVVSNAESGHTSIGVAIAPIAGNALVAVEGGLFVPSASVEVANNAHGLVAVDGVLTLNLATKDSDGAMSKEDKVFIDSIPLELASIHKSIDTLENICAWGEM